MKTKKNNLVKNRIIFLFIVFGILFLTLGGLFSTLWKYTSYSDIAKTICFGIGIIFITTLVTERFLIRLFRDEVGEITHNIFENFSLKSQEAIGQQLNTLFELLRNSEYCGLINILPPRRDSHKEKGHLTFSNIKKSLENAKNVKILCISGREFLWPRVDGGFFDVFEKKAKSNAEYHVQVLLSDPEGHGTNIRGKKEDPQEPDYIKTDVKTSCKEQDKMQRRIVTKDSPLLVEIHFYNFIPQAWIVITDSEMFIEPYHMADTDIIKKSFPKNFTDSDVCCGGRVPIFVIKKDTSLYVAMENYFDWLWDHTDQNIFTEEFKDFFNVKNY